MFISISKIMINHCIFYRKHWNSREKWHCVKPYSLSKCRSGSKSTATHCNVYTVRVKHLAKVTHGYFHDIYSSWKGTITYSEVESGQTNPFKKKREESIHGITNNSTKVLEAQNHDQEYLPHYFTYNKKNKNPKFTFCRE